MGFGNLKRQSWNLTRAACLLVPVTGIYSSASGPRPFAHAYFLIWAPSSFFFSLQASSPACSSSELQHGPFSSDHLA